MDNSKEIAEAEEKLAKLKREQEAYDALSDDKKLAELIHSQTCTHNHIDYCGYHYENWLTVNGTKSHYLKKAQSILQLTDLKTAIAIIKCL